MTESPDPERTIAKIIGEQLGHDPEKITTQTTLDSLGVNSLELVEIIMTIEEEYDIAIDIDTVSAADSIKTVGDLLELGKSMGIGTQ
ncbi:acyl carrier protein [Hoeflea prorocentri]|uniref:Acyl carrier protein n=1 Tax=Hoeflea prorocentri TaxID=1922333 RepID=A0A9X3UGE8_9HYPH|nr:acyl carrier protein [Hoeflea prorocentri]MCY6380318.1 acyl carrier protein [Hoeflea prorocentri]MDA5398118.1 acyl carrier protein [Hoeflea prorocentri]